MIDAIEALIAHQQSLIAALDADDVSAISAHTVAIEAALVRVRGGGVPTAGTVALAAESMRLADEARVRINVLADRTGRRLERLAAATGKGRAAQTYGRDARMLTA